MSSAKSEAAERTPAAVDRPVTVELTEITGPVRYDRLSDALVEVWQLMRVLPLDATQYKAYELFLTRPDAVERAAEFLYQNGRLELSFGLPDGPHVLRILPAGSAASTHEPGGP